MKRILIVDDEPCLREIFTMLFERNGWEVVTANDGAEGVFKFRKAEVPFDGVLSDYQMPRMNGVLMLQEILKLDPNVTVTLASADPPEIKRYLPDTVKVIRKPFSNQELLECFGIR
jgi:CheY-like chemotaxis protein